MNEQKITFADVVAILLWWAIKVGCVFWLIWQWGNWSWLPWPTTWSLFPWPL